MAEHNERSGRREALLALLEGEGDLFELVKTTGEQIMAGIDDLNASIADLQTQVSAENAAVGTLVTELQGVEAQLAALQASGADAVTDQQLEDLATQIAAVSASASAAVAAIPAAPAASSGDTTPPAGDTTAPADGGTTAPAGGDASPDPSAGTDAGSTDAPPADTAPTDTTGDGTAPADGSTVEAPARSVYTFDGDVSTIDPNVWASAGVVTDTGEALYFYSGDTDPGDVKGDGLANAWHVYAGVQSAPPVADPAPGDAAPDAGTEPAAS
jgi:hypothetical protein